LKDGFFKSVVFARLIGCFSSDNNPSFLSAESEEHPVFVAFTSARDNKTVFGASEAP